MHIRKLPAGSRNRRVLFRPWKQMPRGKWNRIQILNVRARRGKNKLAGFVPEDSSLYFFQYCGSNFPLCFSHCLRNLKRCVFSFPYNSNIKAAVLHCLMRKCCYMRTPEGYYCIWNFLLYFLRGVYGWHYEKGCGCKSNQIRSVLFELFNKLVSAHLCWQAVNDFHIEAVLLKYCRNIAYPQRRQDICNFLKACLEHAPAHRRIHKHYFRIAFSHIHHLIPRAIKVLWYKIPLLLPQHILFARASIQDTLAMRGFSLKLLLHSGTSLPCNPAPHMRAADGLE